MTITATQRPYTLVQTMGGARWPLSSEEAQRLLSDPQNIIAASANRVRLPAGAVLVPATQGGGPAFVIER
jgi:hypothetical protein